MSDPFKKDKEKIERLLLQAKEAAKLLEQKKKKRISVLGRKMSTNLEDIPSIELLALPRKDFNEFCKTGFLDEFISLLNKDEYKIFLKPKNKIKKEIEIKEDVIKEPNNY